MSEEITGFYNGRVSKRLTESDLRSDAEGLQRFESSHAHLIKLFMQWNERADNDNEFAQKAIRLLGSDYEKVREMDYVSMTSVTDGHLNKEKRLS